jgi:multiple sugar transport system permease protein
MATQTVAQQRATSAQAERARRFDRLRSLGVMGLLVELLKYAVLVLLAITFIMPFYWMLSSAVKTDSQVYTIPPVWFPVPQYWNNFWDAWNSENYWLFTYNTVVRYAIPATFGTIISSALVAYSFSRLRWIGRDILFAVVLACAAFYHF